MIGLPVLEIKELGADIEESLHPWDKARLVMVYDLFNMLLDSGSKCS